MSSIRRNQLFQVRKTKSGSFFSYIELEKAVERWNLLADESDDLIFMCKKKACRNLRFLSRYEPHFKTPHTKCKGVKHVKTITERSILRRLRYRQKGDLRSHALNWATTATTTTVGKDFAGLNGESFPPPKEYIVPKVELLPCDGSGDFSGHHMSVSTLSDISSPLETVRDDLVNTPTVVSDTVGISLVLALSVLGVSAYNLDRVPSTMPLTNMSTIFGQRHRVRHLRSFQSVNISALNLYGKNLLEAKALGSFNLFLFGISLTCLWFIIRSIKRVTETYCEYNTRICAKLDKQYSCTLKRQIFGCISNENVSARSSVELPINEHSDTEVPHPTLRRRHRWRAEDKQILHVDSEQRMHKILIPSYPYENEAELLAHAMRLKKVGVPVKNLFLIFRLNKKWLNTSLANRPHELLESKEMNIFLKSISC